MKTGMKKKEKMDKKNIKNTIPTQFYKSET